MAWAGDEPSPQSTVADQESAPGSVKLPATVCAPPASRLASAMAPTTGATLITVTFAVAVAVRPSLSVTVNVTGYTPSCTNVCDTDTPDAVAPSPKLHA